MLHLMNKLYPERDAKRNRKLTWRAELEINISVNEFPHECPVWEPKALCIATEKWEVFMNLYHTHPLLSVE